MKKIILLKHKTVLNAEFPHVECFYYGKYFSDNEDTNITTDYFNSNYSTWSWSNIFLINKSLINLRYGK